MDLFGNKCKVPPDAKRRLNKTNNFFMRTVFEEDRRLKQMHQDEIRLTAENPRIRDRLEFESIAENLSVAQREDFLIKKRRQWLREGHEEIRQLEIQLRTAAVSKKLVEQKMLTEARQQEAMRLKREESLQVVKDRLQAEEDRRAQDLAEYNKKMELRAKLMEQMAETRKRRMDEQAVVMQERQEMQEFVRTLEKEKAEEEEQCLRQKMDARDEILTFMEIQEAVRQEQLVVKKDELAEYMKIVDAREEALRQVEALKQRRREERRELSEKIGVELLQTQMEKKQRDDVLLDLLVEERKAKEDVRFKESLEQKLEERRQVRMELERYSKDLERYKEERQVEADKKMREEQLHFLAEQDKLQLLSDEKQRQKRREHTKSVREMLEVQRKQRAFEALERCKEMERLEAMENKLRQEIAEERLRLLRKQPRDVLLFLPPDVLQKLDQEMLEGGK